MRREAWMGFVLAAAALAACSAATEEDLASNADAGAFGEVTSDGPSQAPGPTAAADAGPATEAADAMPQDLFALAATYATPLPERTASQIHKAKGVNPEQPSRQSCLESLCHAGNSAPFAFAVTICADAKCRAYAADAEVRVVGKDGAVFSARTGADGNAWFYDNGKLALPARVAIRKGATTKVMTSDLSPGTQAGSCNMQGCHGADPEGTKPDAGRNVVLVLP